MQQRGARVGRHRREACAEKGGAKVVIVSAAGEGRAPMVATALSGEFGAYDCPAGMVEAAEDTLWFTDKEGIAEFDAQELEEDEE